MGIDLGILICFKKKNFDKYYAINLKGSIYAVSNLGTTLILLRKIKGKDIGINKMFA